MRVRSSVSVTNWSYTYSTTTNPLSRRTNYLHIPYSCHRSCNDTFEVCRECFHDDHETSKQLVHLQNSARDSRFYIEGE